MPGGFVADTPCMELTRAALPRSLRVFWAGAALGSVLMFVVAGFKAHLGMPRDSWNPLCDPLFGDLLEYVPTLRLVHTAAFWGNPVTSPVAYPPFAVVLLALLYGTGHTVAVYLAIAAAGVSFAASKMAQELARLGVRWAVAGLFSVGVVVFSFPILGLMQRGNIELLLWLFAALGTWAWMHEREDAAAVLWGLAAAVKLYPIVYLALLWPRRKYRAFALGMGTFCLASWGAMVWIGPSLSVAWHGSLHNVFGYQSVRVAEWSMHELAANHSAFGLVKLAATLAGVGASGLTRPYFACSALLFVGVFFGRVTRLPRVNQLLLVSLFMVMLPPVSYFYTLVHLYGPLVLLVLLAMRAAKAGVRVPVLRAVLLLYVPVTVAYTVFTYRAVLLFGGLVQALALCGLMACAVLYPLQLPVERLRAT